MDLQRLEYFFQLSQTESIREAAELLHITPAALSKAIKVLESELDLKLITAQGRGVILTDDGLRLAQNCAEFLSHAKDFKENPLGDNNQIKTFKIGSFEVFTGHLLSQIIKKIPVGIDIEIRELIPGELERELAENKIDLGLTYLPVSQKNIEFLKLGSIEMGIYGKMEVFKNLPFAELPFVIPVTDIKEMPNKVKGLDGWPDNKINRLVRYRVALLESALELARSGLAVCYIPKVVAREHNKKIKNEFKLSEFPVPSGVKSTKQSVYLVKRKTSNEDDLTKKITSSLREILKS
jgi:DNA-binding transcriptional LysR family regulator